MILDVKALWILGFPSHLRQDIPMATVRTILRLDHRTCITCTRRSLWMPQSLLRIY